MYTHNQLAQSIRTHKRAEGINIYPSDTLSL